MCLYTTRSMTRAFKNALQKDWFWGYKVVKIVSSTLYEDNKFSFKEILRSQYHNYEWVPGWNVAVGETKLQYVPKIKFSCGYAGIHIYLNKNDALENQPSTYRLIKVKCFKKDLIAVGDCSSYSLRTKGKIKQAVLKQVYLDTKDYKKALEC